MLFAAEAVENDIKELWFILKGAAAGLPVAAVGKRESKEEIRNKFIDSHYTKLNIILQKNKISWLCDFKKKKIGNFFYIELGDVVSPKNGPLEDIHCKSLESGKWPYLEKGSL